MNRVQNLRLIAIAGRCLVALALFPQALLFAQDRQEPATLLTVWAGMLPIIFSAPTAVVSRFREYWFGVASEWRSLPQQYCRAY
jgi:hypothetical protein